MAKVLKLAFIADIGRCYLRRLSLGAGLIKHTLLTDFIYDGGEIDAQRATISASIHLLLPFVKQHKMNYLS